MLEADAKLTEDGVPVAIHDATLDRTTNCTGEVRTFTLAELAGCKTDVLGSPGSPFPAKQVAKPAPIIAI
jgi:glycerophosphoryl diester phosphodiesterase